MGRKNQYLDNLQQFGETDVPTQDVTSLKKYFSSLTEALDNTTSELGAGYYKTAKNKTMTLRKIKRRPLTALQDVFEKGKTLPEDEEEEEPKTPTEFQVESDKDLAQVMIDIIHTLFYDPQHGLWPEYDKAFKKEDYTKHGKPGWDGSEDTVQRLQAREEINRLKNVETTKLMEGKFTTDSIQAIIQQLSDIITGVKPKDVKHAVRNHVRDHLNNLVY